MKAVKAPPADSSYIVSGADLAELAHRFTDTVVTSENGELMPTQTRRVKALNQKALEFALEITANCPKSREQAVALTNLEQSLFWAWAAIYRNEVSVEKDSITARVEAFRGMSKPDGAE